MRIEQGRWVTNQGDPIETIEDRKLFVDNLNRVKEFSRGRELTHDKINVLFKLLTTDISSNIYKLLLMDAKELKKLC